MLMFILQDRVCFCVVGTKWIGPMATRGTRLKKLGVGFGSYPDEP